jgi:hypothetical protein
VAESKVSDMLEKVFLQFLQFWNHRRNQLHHYHRWVLTGILLIRRSYYTVMMYPYTFWVIYGDRYTVDFKNFLRCHGGLVAHNTEYDMVSHWEMTGVLSIRPQCYAPYLPRHKGYFEYYNNFPSSDFEKWPDLLRFLGQKHRSRGYTRTVYIFFAARAIIPSKPKAQIEKKRALKLNVRAKAVFQYK